MYVQYLTWKFLSKYKFTLYWYFFYNSTIKRAITGCWVTTGCFYLYMYTESICNICMIVYSILIICLYISQTTIVKYSTIPSVSTPKGSPSIWGLPSIPNRNRSSAEVSWTGFPPPVLGLLIWSSFSLPTERFRYRSLYIYISFSCNFYNIVS